MRIYTLIKLLSCSIYLISCQKVFNYNENEVRLEEKDKNQNIKNIERLQSKIQGDDFRFAVIADSQRFYEEMDDFVREINSYPDISFVILNGDITDFSLNNEYLWISDRLQKLKMPFVVVIGNHDMLGNGREIYKQMFGPENFSFTYSDYKFIALNTNAKEVGFNGSLPDFAWLEQQLSTTPADQKVFVIAHMAPFSGDFDRSLEMDYVKALSDSGNVLYSIHGHEDIYYSGQTYGPPVNYLVVNSLGKRQFVIINVDNDSIQVEKRSF